MAEEAERGLARAETSAPRGSVPITVSNEDFLRLKAVPLKLASQVTPLVVETRAGAVLGVGTAFTIAQSRLDCSVFLFATAAHNLHFDSRVMDGTWRLLVLLPRKDQDAAPGLNAFYVLQASMMGHSCDVALLRVQVEDTVVAPQPMPLETGIPRTGQICLGMGYPETRIGDRSGLEIQIDELHLATARGRIEEVHPSGRDRSMVSFPAFRTDSHFPSGMSGGPVLDNTTQPRVIGVVSCSTADLNGPVPDLSYSSMIAPALKLPVPGLDGDETPLFNRLDSWFISLAGPTTTISSTDEGRLEVTWPEESGAKEGKARM